MIIKNILLEAKNGKLKIEISDANMLPNEKEKDVSAKLNKTLEMIVNNDNFIELINM